MIQTLRDGLDEMVNDPSCDSPEWYHLNAVRFMEHYKIMRAMEQRMEAEQNK